MIEIELAVADGLAPDTVPSADEFRRWVANALEGLREEALVDLRVVDATEMRELNRAWRDKDHPTNVLSFPAEAPPGVELPLLGDIALCAPVVEREAREQDKPAAHHWAHLVTHGVLHLLGYDHMDDEQAREMEAMERSILARLGIPDPYRD